MKNIITIFFIALSTIAFGQTNEIKAIEINDELNEKTDAFFNSYFKLIEAQKWDEIAVYMPEKFIELIGKEAFVGQMKKSFNNDAFTTTFNKMSFTNIPSAFSYNNITYANVNYFNSFTFHFNKTEEQSNDDFNDYMEFMTGTLANQFKDQKVERKGKDIIISGDKMILIIDNPKANGLKMLELNKNMAEFYKMFLPEPVVNKLLE